MQPEPLRFRDSNVAVVAGERAALVVDAGSDPAKVRWLVERVRQELRNGDREVPVRFLVATHWHGDHTQGLEIWRQAFPELVVLGHRSLLRDIPERAAPALAEEVTTLASAVAAGQARWEEGIGEGGVPLDEAARSDLAGRLGRARERLASLEVLTIPPPDVALSEAGGPPEGGAEAGVALAAGSARIDLGGRAVELIALPGHTDGDLVAWLPAEKVLVSGDLLDALPFGGHGQPVRWLAHLERLASLPFETLVPGHGPVYRGDEARRQLQRVTSLFRFLVEEAAAAAGRGDDDEAALAALRSREGWSTHRAALAGDGELLDRVWEAFVPETFRRALEQARETAAARAGPAAVPAPAPGDGGAVGRGGAE